MSLKFQNNMIASEIQQAGFYGANHQFIESFYFMERCYKYSLLSYHNDFITNSYTTHMYTFFRDTRQGPWGSESRDCGLYFKRVNDMIYVYGGASDNPESDVLLYHYEYNSPPVDFNFLFLYGINKWDYEHQEPYPVADWRYSFWIVRPDMYISSLQVTDAPAAYGVPKWLYGEKSADTYDISIYPSIPLDYAKNYLSFPLDQDAIQTFIEYATSMPVWYDTWAYDSITTTTLGYITNPDGTDPEVTDPSEGPFNPSGPDPYNPDGDDTSDPVGIPSNPVYGVTSAGFINVYKPGLNALQGLGDILFPDMPTTSDIVEAVKQLSDVIMNQNLINYVIDCHIIPAGPQVGANANIKVGFKDTGISVPKVTSDYVDQTCGSISLPEFFSSFADYLYTKSKLYLPFIGFVDMLPEYWQAGTISVDYKFNIIDGSFMCFVRSKSSKSKLNNSVIAQYGGNACMHLPLTGINYASMISGLVQATSGLVDGANPGDVMSGASSIINTFAQGGQMQQSNAYNSTACLLGVRTPYLLIERPTPSWSSKYRHDQGLPSNIATTLSTVTGYTEIEDIDLTGIPLTKTELDELKQLLTEGVYF